MARCSEMMWRGWDHLQCPHPAKYGDFCGVHSPERKEARATERGPTQYERDTANRRKRDAREKALLNVLEQARKVVSGDMTKFLSEAIDAYDKVG